MTYVDVCVCVYMKSPAEILPDVLCCMFVCDDKAVNKKKLITN